MHTPRSDADPPPQIWPQCCVQQWRMQVVWGRRSPQYRRHAVTIFHGLALCAQVATTRVCQRIQCLLITQPPRVDACTSCGDVAPRGAAYSEDFGSTEEMCDLPFAVSYLALSSVRPALLQCDQFAQRWLIAQVSLSHCVTGALAQPPASAVQAPKQNHCADLQHRNFGPNRKEKNSVTRNEKE